jgi:nucleoside-diphosphate-sugar epimerase
VTVSRVLVTGATGFVGRYVVANLAHRGHLVRATVRNAASASLPKEVEVVETGDLTPNFAWDVALEGVCHIVHAAGLAHADAHLAEARYDLVNTQVTLALAQAAVKSNARRFVYLSSIRAQTGFSADLPLSERDDPRPTDAYGRSKLAAERGLAALDIAWVALRPVVVYGPGVKANMSALMRLAQSPLPLPLAGLGAGRSILAIENLADAIAFCLTPDCPERRAYIVADPDPVNIAGMIAAMRAGLGRSPGMFKVPEVLLASLAWALGESGRYKKLVSGLIASPAALTEAGWKPPVRSEVALAQLMAGRVGA